jgi:hypothetical protein
MSKTIESPRTDKGQQPTIALGTKTIPSSDLACTFSHPLMLPIRDMFTIIL